MTNEEVMNRVETLPTEDSKLKEEIHILLNKVSRENNSDTPDFILAEYMLSCLRAFEKATNEREVWYGRIESSWVGE